MCALCFNCTTSKFYYEQLALPHGCALVYYVTTSQMRGHTAAGSLTSQQFSDFTCALSVRTRMVRTFVSLLRHHYVPHAPRAKPLPSLHHAPACSTARWPRNRMVASVLGGRSCSRRDSCATRLPRQLCLIASYVFHVPAASLHQPSLDLSAARSLSVLMRGSARCAMKSLS